MYWCCVSGWVVYDDDVATVPLASGDGDDDVMELCVGEKGAANGDE
jgi:hypothetical protein